MKHPVTPQEREAQMYRLPKKVTPKVVVKPKRYEDDLPMTSWMD